MINLINSFAYHPDDSTETRFSKNLILVVAISCSTCGIIWGMMYYLFMGAGLTMFLPLAFTVIVGSAIPISHWKRNHQPLIYAQLTCITWISAFIQWSIGSLHDSGMVIVWSFLGPVGALFFLKKNQSYLWMAMFILIILISALLEPKWSDDAANLTENARKLFYVMNLCIPTSVVFMAALYFVSNLIEQKSLNLEIQKQLIKSEKMAAFGVVATRLAHEIQNPLNFINNFSELSKGLAEEINARSSETEKKENTELLLNNLQKINEHGKRVAAIVSQLQEQTNKGTAHEFFEQEK